MPLSVFAQENTATADPGEASVQVDVRIEVTPHQVGVVGAWIGHRKD